jgi:hypothetical protein
MPYTNIDATLSETERADILDAINLIVSKMPFLINLTPSERQTLPKMGNVSQSFVSKALEIATNNPQFIPPYVSINELRKDYQLSTQLQGIRMQVASLLEKISDTNIAVGSEAYVTALMVYNSLKAAAKINAPGADAFLAELSARFALDSNPDTPGPEVPAVP